LRARQTQLIHGVLIYSATGLNIYLARERAARCYRQGFRTGFTAPTSAAGQKGYAGGQQKVSAAILNNHMNRNHPKFTISENSL
jgi:hypothetical protein